MYSEWRAFCYFLFPTGCGYLELDWWIRGSLARHLSAARLRLHREVAVPPRWNAEKEVAEKDCREEDTQKVSLVRLRSSIPVQDDVESVDSTSLWHQHIFKLILTAWNKITFHQTWFTECTRYVECVQVWKLTFKVTVVLCTFVSP